MRDFKLILINILFLIIFTIKPIEASVETSSFPTLEGSLLNAYNISLSSVSVLDSEGIFFINSNPALSSSLKRFSIYISYIPWIFNTRFFIGTTGYKIGKYTIAGEIVSFSVDNFTALSINGYEEGSVGMKENLFKLNFSTIILNLNNFFLASGINLNYLNSKIYKYSTSFFLIDGGINSKILLKNKSKILFSFSLHNISNNVKYIKDTIKIPLSFIGEAGYKYFLNNYTFYIGVKAEDKNIDTGVEVGLKNIIYLRGGYNIISENRVFSKFSYGIGIKYFKIQLDYSAKIYLNNNITHLISIGYNL